MLKAELELAGVRLVDKERVWHQRLCGWLLWLVTLGAQAHYLDQYVTTIGRRIYLPRDWAARPAIERYITLRHERVHLDQFRQ